jgi:hypothetical protein
MICGGTVATSERLSPKKMAHPQSRNAAKQHNAAPFTGTDCAPLAAQVALGRGHGLVPQEVLDIAQVGVVLNQVTCAGVPPDM